MNLRALLELCRISNLPTVWSNAAAGVFAGSLIAEVNLNVALFFAPLAAIPISLIYCGGMVLNDVIDRHIDLIERPHRPIPSNRIPVSLAWFLAITLLGLPLLFIACVDALNKPLGPGFHFVATLNAIALVITVILYNIVHQQHVFSVIFMAICRAGVVLCAAALIAGNDLYLLVEKSLFVYGIAATLFLYTLAISIVARREMETKRFAGPKTVMNMIAAMPLLDAVWLFIVGLWPASLFCVACSVLTKLGHRKVAGS